MRRNVGALYSAVRIVKWSHCDVALLMRPFFVWVRTHYTGVRFDMVAVSVFTPSAPKICHLENLGASQSRIDRENIEEPVECH